MIQSLWERVHETATSFGLRFTSKLTYALPLVILLLGLYWLVPRYSFRGDASLNPSERDQIRRFVGDVTASVEAANASASSTPSKDASKAGFIPTCHYCTDFREITVALTPLVSLLVKVPVEIYGDYYRPTIGHVGNVEYWPTVRADNVVLMFLILVGVTLGLRAVRFVPTQASLVPTHVIAGVPENSTSAEALLEADVVKAEERARDVYRRSTILLGGGIAMAFVGVALFYVTLPNLSSTDDRTSARILDRYAYELDRLGTRQYLLEREYRNSLQGRRSSSALTPEDESYLRELSPSPAIAQEHPWLTFASHSLRPTGMLIFMEGIAWFLLRQYRVLIEEYKSFLRVYLRRSSYLVAWKAASSSPDKQLAIAQLMMTEDMSSALKKEETTEALEAMRLSASESTPIVAVLREVKGLIPALNKK